MPETADVVERADSLILRRRTFVAQRPTPPVAPQSPSPQEDDDLPILTEVVPPEEALAEEKTERIDETQITLLASEIAHAFGEQLASELPDLIENALLRTSKELRAGIATIMEGALRDFLARRKQLHLPLDDSESRG